MTTDWQINPALLRADLIRPQRHPLAGLVDASAFVWQSLRGQRCPLDPEELVQRAEQLTGLRDWGDGEDWQTPLRLLAAPRQDRAALTALGWLALEHFLVERLANRLRIESRLQANPAVARQPVRKPLVVVGLPRTGTTFLQNLLSLDPQCRPMFGWYTWDLREPDQRRDRRQRRLRRASWLLYRFLPGLRAVHWSSPDGPEECLPLQMNSLRSAAFGLVADQQEYTEWLRTQDMTSAYLLYARQLQLLQSHLPEGHWVLKSPAYLAHLGALVHALPEARIVQLHRDPRQVVLSTLSLRHTVMGAVNRLVPERLPELIGDSLDNVLWTVEQNLEERRAVAPEQLVDIRYADLVANPIATVRAIYAHFGYAWTAAFESRLGALLSVTKAHARPRHVYSAEMFGLAPERIGEVFADYVERFGIPQETPRDSVVC